MGPHLTIILKKQFEIAGYSDKFDTIDFKNTQWYQDLTWNSDQEMEFKKWATDYLYKGSMARKEVMNYPSLHTKKDLYNWFNWWNLSYGFRIDNNLKYLENEDN